MDAEHTRQWWDECFFFAVRGVTHLIDRFVFGVDFHIADKHFALSPFASSRLDRAPVNFYSRIATGYARALGAKDLASAHLIIEDTAFLANFGGLIGAMLAHYHRAYKESPKFAEYRKKREEMKKERAAKKVADLAERKRKEDSERGGE